jgi:hypothetical protein
MITQNQTVSNISYIQNGTMKQSKKMKHNLKQIVKQVKMQLT